MENDQRVNVSEELEYLKSIIDSLDNQINSLAKAIEELGRTFSTLKDSEAGESKETRISLGSGIYVEAKLDLDKKLMVPIGSDLFIEEEPKKTVERLENNIKELSNSLASLQQQRKDAEYRYNAIVALVQQQSGKKAR
ncbi:MAG: prefoldin subunit alpha [Thermoplasmatales archaeon]|nr:prefoldin subunit alpha [Thermoplasmatales archaeon]